MTIMHPAAAIKCLGEEKTICNLSTDEVVAVIYKSYMLKAEINGSYPCKITNIPCIFSFPKIKEKRIVLLELDHAEATIDKKDAKGM